MKQTAEKRTKAFIERAIPMEVYTVVRRHAPITIDFWYSKERYTDGLDADLSLNLKSIIAKRYPKKSKKKLKKTK